MTTHGSLSAFDPGKEDWSSYVLRLKFYFNANGVTEDDMKKSILLTAVGPATFRKIGSILTVARLDTIKYDDLVSEVKNYFDPKPSVIVQRFRFNTRVRAATETVAAYVAALRRLAEHCDYADATLNEMIRDRLVCGVSHDGIQTRLLAEKDLTYESALQLAQAIEAAEQNSKILKNGAVGSQPVAATSDVHYQKFSNSGQERKNSHNTDRPPPTCYRCGGPHLAPVCKHINDVCKYCKKKGHLAKVCRARLKAFTKGSASGGSPTPPDSTPQKDQKVNLVDHKESTPENDSVTYKMFNVNSDRVDPIIAVVYINSVPVEMEVDTGASLSILNVATYESIKHQAPLEKATANLSTYTGEAIPVLGKAKVSARYDNTVSDLYIYVVDGAGPNLMGRDWISSLKPLLGNINHVDETTLQSVLDQHADVFKDELGCMKGIEVDLHVRPGAKPKFFKPHSVPLSRKKLVEEELMSLEAKGIITPVKTSKWAVPIVTPLKRNGSIRICGDFKSLNQVTETESYPLPRIEELFAKLQGGELFTKLDLANAYLQLPLSQSSKEYVTVNTHKGLYRYNRLPFGVASSPAIFQRAMETLLSGIPGVAVYMDDIVVTGKSTPTHLKTLDRVLQILSESGLRLNREKCYFLRSKVEYLGHIIDAEGLHPTEEKITAIKNAPVPKNVTELRSFLGIVNYYSKFLPALSTHLAPLYRLLHKQTKWSWTSTQEKAFLWAKNALQADSLLVHYDPNKPLIVECDASQYGLGAVLSHKMDNGQERPIAFTSRTLSPAEKKYSQLEKEGLAIVFGVTKFHNYLYGQRFSIRSDHQPLSFLFSELKGVPVLASSRIQRWALTLTAYQYSIVYKPGRKLQNADALSRLPLSTSSNHDGLTGDHIHVMEQLDQTAISSARIKTWTSRDPLLSKVKHYILQGFPTTPLDSSFTPYTSKAAELSVLDGCILWGARVVVPPQGREAILSELHETHPGCTRMKALARSYVWWPRMDSDIEDVVKKCHTCQESRPAPPVAPLHPWEWPSKPWSRLHLDFAGPFCGHNFLVQVDAYSKWMDVILMSSTTSAKTIEKLRIVFSTHGLPLKVVTDNGSAFTSHEFRQFMEKNNIKHVTSAPYHPSTNGLAERAVQTFKRAIERMSGMPIQERLSKFLFNYRLTPHSTTGVAPAELLLGRRPRARLDNLHPDLSERVEHKQKQQKADHDVSKPLRNFTVGDAVFAKNFSGTLPRWLPGTVVQVSGPLSYVIKLTNGQTVRRHVDAVRSREGNTDPTPSSDPPSPSIPVSVPVVVQPQPVTPPPHPDLPPVNSAPPEEITATHEQITANPEEIDLPPDDFLDTFDHVAAVNSTPLAAPKPIPAPSPPPQPMFPTSATQPSYWRGSGVKRGRV